MEEWHETTGRLTTDPKTHGAKVRKGTEKALIKTQKTDAEDGGLYLGKEFLPFLNSFSLNKVQACPGIDADKDDEERLHGVDDEDEVESLLVGYAIKNEHGLYCKMPRAGAVRRRHDDGDAAYDKSDQGT